MKTSSTQVLKRRVWMITLLVAVAALGAISFRRPVTLVSQTVATPVSTSAVEPKSTQPKSVIPATPEAKRLNYQVVGTYAHDARAFTQGLLWFGNGFYESTGLNGQSTLRRVAFPSGRVLEKRRLPSQYFAEGLALANNKLVQLTWTDGKAFVYDRATFKLLHEWSYEGEGWGLTFDGKNFVMSNGSDILTWRDPKTFKVVRQVRVQMNGQPLTQLNEIEWIDGSVWANVWQTDFIVQIDPKSGQVVSYLDLSNLHVRGSNEDVLNGIAYDAAKKRIFITGKLWPQLYEIKVR